MDTPDRAWIDGHVEGYVLKDAELDYLVDLLESVGQRAGAEATVDLPRALTSVGGGRTVRRRRA